MLRLTLSIFLGCLWIPFRMEAQPNIYPAPAQKGSFIVKNVTIHIGNGEIIEDGMVEVKDGKFTKVARATGEISGQERVIDGGGKQLYPGLILSYSNLGLTEIASLRASNDFTELGELNASVRALVAYNTDSRVINTLRANGVLLACITPRVTSSGLIAGSSSVVQLDAWNWEDAAYQPDQGIHLYIPSLLRAPVREEREKDEESPLTENLKRIETVRKFFREAKGYLSETTHEHTNLNFEAVRGLFEGKQKLFVHCGIVREMLIAIDFVKEFGMRVVIVGGNDSWQIADLLKANNIEVILGQLHQLPTLADDGVDQPYRTPAILQKAGVKFAINDEDDMNRGRNLAYNAGTAVAYGLTKEQALMAITSHAAEILGIADRTGSIEAGKDANFVLSEGDILDMRSSRVTDAFIQGRTINLDNKQKQLFERYKYKYGL